MEINQVIAFNYKDKFNAVKLPFDDNEIKNLNKIFNYSNDVTLKEYNDEELKPQKKFKLNNTDNYLMKIFEDLFEKLTTNELKILNSLKDFFDKEGFAYTGIVYLSTDKNKGLKRLDIYELRKSLKVNNKKVWLNFFKKKVGTGTADALQLFSLTDGFYLPIDNCLCSFVVNNKYDSKKTLNIYNVYKIDEIFNSTKIMESYASTTVDRLNGGSDRIKLTSDNLDVCFEDDISNINKKIKSDKNLMHTFAVFSGNGNSKIKKISKKQLNDVFEKLYDYAGENKSKFKKNDIPSLDLNSGEIKVKTNQIPIFAGLLNNKIIERLLDGEIVIPYYN
ncbi:hypothetical protein [Fructilactobacillus cliffordii]|uniref:Uncharacterized protein n=1 Tax=Fructilactobacillus cliffordii TaxID=2940299 RepID=A0A9Q9E3E9_9LACO|nr:hypothetical protein [Fructilactobacillus cliffordii]USS89854.1 hypothetical protein M3M40_03525 [Fructilactobacillus cliffordii]